MTNTTASLIHALALIAEVERRARPVAAIIERQSAEHGLALFVIDRGLAVAAGELAGRRTRCRARSAGDIRMPAEAAIRA